MRVKCEEILVMRLVGPVIKDLNYNNTNTGAIKVKNSNPGQPIPIQKFVFFVSFLGISNIFGRKIVKV